MHKKSAMKENKILKTPTSIKKVSLKSHKSLTESLNHNILT